MTGAVGAAAPQTAPPHRSAVVTKTHANKKHTFLRTRMATSRTLLLLLLLAATFLVFTGQSHANPRAQGLFNRIGDSSRGNYTVSFVPLISVIANYFPRILGRFSPHTQNGRSQNAINASVMAATCNEVHPQKILWPDPKNQNRFLFCHLDQDCVALLQKSGVNATFSVVRCYSLRTEKCPAKTAFDFHQQRCVYK